MVPASLAVKPGSAQFGSVVELGGHGGSSKQVFVTLINPKNRRQNIPIQILDIGSQTQEFKVQSTSCVRSLAPGGTCQIPLIFSPTGTGLRTGTLIIRDNTGKPSQPVTLHGRGVQGKLTYKPLRLSFGRVTMHHQSSVINITLQNNNPIPMTLSGPITISNPDFAFTTTCGNTITNGQPCSISVSFTPSQKRTESATITIPDDASGSPHKVMAVGVGS
jgi:hypothetical protein